MPRIMMLKRT